MQIMPCLPHSFKYRSFVKKNCLELKKTLKQGIALLVVESLKIYLKIIFNQV